MIRMAQRSYVWMAWVLILSAITAASAQDSTASAQQLPNDPAVVRSQTATGTAQGANDQRPTTTPAQQQQSETPDFLNTSQELPNDPGASRSQTTTGATQRANDQQPAGAQAQQQQNQTPPVGTAAAPEAPAVSGVAASKPVGAVIAPAKQRRTRSFFIKLSAIVGGAAAIGTVAALSRGSPSKPPGAH